MKEFSIWLCNYNSHRIKVCQQYSTFLNIKGIRNKTFLGFLQDIVENYDIIGLAETLSNHVDTSVFPSFEIFTGSVKFSLKRGTHGLEILVRKSLKHEFLFHFICLNDLLSDPIDTLQPRSNQDHKVNSNGRMLNELCKTTGVYWTVE